MAVVQKLSELKLSVMADEDRPGLVLISIGDLALEATQIELAGFTAALAQASTEANRLQVTDTQKQVNAFLERVASRAQ